MSEVRDSEDEDCPGCTGGVFHEHGGACEVCGDDCHTGQQYDLSDDIRDPKVVYLCDRHWLTERRTLAAELNQEAGA